MHLTSLSACFYIQRDQRKRLYHHGNPNQTIQVISGFCYNIVQRALKTFHWAVSSHLWGENSSGEKKFTMHGGESLGQ